MDPSGQQTTISIPPRGKKKKNERAPKNLKVKTTKTENSKLRQKCPDSSPPERTVVFKGAVAAFM
jgi:hypothetical protein